MSAYRSLLETWTRYINEQDLEAGLAATSDDIRIVAFHEGVGGPESVIEGRASVDVWVQKPAKGRYELSINWDEVTDTDSDPRMRDCDAYVRAPFTISIVQTDWAGWTNQAVWTVGIRDGRILDVIHEPAALTDAQMDMTYYIKDKREHEEGEE